jgi:thiol-disulfide isomerase/thioredoxin
MKKVLFIFFLAGLVGCTENPLEARYDNAERSTTRPASILDDKKGLVLLFLSPECPLCINYAPELQKLNSTFQDFSFLGVVSGNFYPHDITKRYLIKYDLEFDVIYDTGFLLAKKYGATITPEVVVIDSEGKPIYKGAIDNWAISLGKKRSVVTEHYLSDALQALRMNEKPQITETKAVGCFIE